MFFSLKAPPYDGYPTCKMRPTSLYAGQRLYLTCNSAGGIPPATLTWKDRDIFLTQGPGTEGDQDDMDRGSRELVHSFRVNETHNGKQFLCSAANMAITILHERGMLPSDTLTCMTDPVDVKREYIV